MMLTALYADKRGEIFDAPGRQAAGRTGWRQRLLTPEDMIPLPAGADLMYLPGRAAVAGGEGRLAPLGDGLLAVAAMLPVGYTRTYLPAFELRAEAPALPLYGYTAVGLHQDRIYAAAVKSDNNDKWHPRRYNTPDLRRKVAQVRRDLPGNRIVEQLAGCSLEWHCCTAQNLFYRRWEAGIPVSPVCNANCMGCISLQPAECCPAPQSRIAFAPAAEEIAAVGVYHLSTAREPIISFGQGCEGEPSLASAAVTAAIGLIRARTERGIININTNAGYIDGIAAIVDAGLNSMRVSMISALDHTYRSYYRPEYSPAAVKQSIKYAIRRGVRVSLNMLLFPGLNDHPAEAEAWESFIAETGIDMIQLRNLNMDPDLLAGIVPADTAGGQGVTAFINCLRQTFPKLRIGSFTPYWEEGCRN